MLGPLRVKAADVEGSAASIGLCADGVGGRVWQVLDIAARASLIKSTATMASAPPRRPPAHICCRLFRTLPRSANSKLFHIFIEK